MEEKYQCSYEMIQAGDYFGAEVQAFFLPASHRTEQRFGYRIHSPFTMIICNPNLGFAESTIVSDDWIDFYLNLGINVVLWNYRGYSNSTGVPSPAANRRDVEQVYKWALYQTNLKINN